jgi:hypothetical protein
MSLGRIGQTKADPSREINAGVLGKTSMVTPGAVFQPDEIAFMRLALDDAETHPASSYTNASDESRVGIA